MTRLFQLVVFYCLFSLTTVNALSQDRAGTITGSVVDARTGEGLPGATIQIEGLFVGTITNDAGNFSLTVSAFPARLIVRFIGYQSATQGFRAAPDAPVRFALAPSRIALPEIVVTGENPAINIMRRVIEEKQRWRKSFQSYRVNAYNRFRIENDSGIVSIWESSTLAFWDKDRGIREISLSQRQTANTEIDGLLPAALFMNNLYDDDIEVAGHTLIGVTHPDALNQYEFSLAGTRAIDDRLVFDINVQPHSRLGSGFVGTVAVLDSVYALLSVDLKPGESFLFPPPIKGLTVRYRQQFSRFGSEVWLPVDLRSSITLDISFGGLLSFPTFRIEQSARLSDFELNIPVPDSLYESDESVVVDSTLISKMEMAKLEDLAIPLTADEIRAYETIDSTMTLEKAFKPKGLLARLIEVSGDSSDRDRGRRDSNAPGRPRSFFSEHVDLRFSPASWFNQVEGWHIGGAPSVEVNNRIRLTGRLGYATARKSWTYGANVRVGSRSWIEVGYLDHVPQRYDSAVNGRFLNSISVLSSRPDYFDYLHEKGGSISVGTQMPGWSAATGTLRFSSSRHSNVVLRSYKAWFGTPDDAIPNAEIDEGTLRSIVLSLQYEADSAPYGIGAEYSAHVDVERSLGGSVVESGGYTRINGAVVWRIPTFYRRRLLPNTLDFKLAAGTFSGNLPRQRFGTIDGSTFLTTFGGLRTRKDRPYEGESYALFAAEHSFRTIFFERLGLYQLARYGWNVILTGAIAKTWISSVRSEEFYPAIENLDQLHSEIGLSLSGLFGMIRLDYTRRLDIPGNFVGISVARMF